MANYITQIDYDTNSEDIGIIRDTIHGYTDNTGTITKVVTANGLTGGPITSSGTIKCNLKSETKSTLAAAAISTTSGREYPIGLDSSSKLSVNVPWSNTTYTAGTNISISSNTVNVANIGTYGSLEGNNSAERNINHNAWTLATATSNVHQFEVGVFVIKAHINWKTYNASSGGTAAQTRQGYRMLLFSETSANGSALNRFATDTIKAYNSSTNQAIDQELVFIWKNNTANKKIYLNAWQNSGGPLIFNYPGYQWVRIA